MSSFSSGYGDKNGRNKVFNFQMSKLGTKIVNEKPEEVFKKLDSAAKITRVCSSKY